MNIGIIAVWLSTQSVANILIGRLVEHVEEHGERLKRYGEFIVNLDITGRNNYNNNINNKYTVIKNIIITVRKHYKNTNNNNNNNININNNGINILIKQ